MCLPVINKEVDFIATNAEEKRYILAADIEIDPDQLRKARVRCVKEVKETNGEISFEDAVRYQQEAE